MFAGKTHYDIGTRVRIKGITDPNDIDLNGREGTLCQPRRDQRPINDVGIILDARECTPELCVPYLHDLRLHECGEDRVAVYLHEFEVIR